jgi:hypothetical protein
MFLFGELESVGLSDKDKTTQTGLFNRQNTAFSRCI